MPKIRKVASALNDIAGLKSSRYEKLQVSYGTVGGTHFAGVGSIAGTTLTISAVFAGTVTISGTTLTLASVSTGKLVLGAPIIGVGIAAGTYISSVPTNGGNTPTTTTCTVSVRQTVAVATAVTCGSLAVGDVINNSALDADGNKAYITALSSGTTGGVGTYTLSAAATVGGGTTIYGGSYGLGETLTFADVPSQDIVKATVVAHGDSAPSVLDVYPASSRAGVFELLLSDLANVTFPVKLSYIIEYIRGGGRVGTTTEASEGELFRVTVNTGTSLAATVAEQQVAESE